MNVCVLLAVYNGEDYLKDQLDSIFSQVGVQTEIIARDDGSADHTVQILKEYERRKNFQLVRGGHEGAFGNFIELIKLAPESDYYAYSDQDDVWMPEKLVTGISKIDDFKNEGKPILYFGKNTAVDEKLKPIKKRDSRKFREVDSLALALVRNICQGSTCIFNNELMKFIKMIPSDFKVEHDWWTYLVCISVGGRVIADESSHMLYRQHGKNVLGDSISLSARIKRRSRLIFSKHEHSRQRMCNAILTTYKGMVTPSAGKVLMEIMEYRESLPKMLKLLFDYRFYKGGAEYSVSFVIAVLMQII